MTSNPNKATIHDAAEDTDRKAWEAQMLLREEPPPPEQPVDVGLVAQIEAEDGARIAADKAVFFDKDTFKDEHSTPSTGAIWNINKTGEYTKPNIDNLVSWIKTISGEHFLSVNQGRELFIWRAGCYVPGAEGYIRTLLEVVNDGVGVTPTHINHTVHRIGSSSIGSNIEQGWSKHTVLNNCVLNTKTGEITPHTPDLHTFSKLSCDYDKDATCPVWQEFLDYALPDKDDQRTLQEMFGATLKRDYHEQAAFFLLGAGGNGKGVCMDILREMLGHGAYSAVKLQEVAQRFYTSSLHNKYANISGDTARTALLDTSTYKMLTGGDVIHAEYKGKDGFEFRSHATIISSFNELPPSKDQTDAFFRRFVLIPFNVKPTPERVKEKRGFDGVIKDGEMAGVLNWAIEGLERLNKQCCFTWQLEKSVSDLRKVWNVEAERVNGFIMDCCERTGSIEPGTFYHAYTKWHVARYDTPPNEEQAEVTKARSKYGIGYGGRKTYDNAHLWDDRKSVTCYTHISLKTTEGNLSVYPDYVDTHWHEIMGLMPAQPQEQPVDGGCMVTDMRAALDKAFELARDKHIKGVSARDVYQAHPKGLGESSISEILNNDQTMLGIIKKDGLYFRRG